MVHSGSQLRYVYREVSDLIKYRSLQREKEGGLRVINWALSRTKIALFLPLRGPYKLAQSTEKRAKSRTTGSPRPRIEPVP